MPYKDPIRRREYHRKASLKFYKKHKDRVKEAKRSYHHTERGRDKNLRNRFGITAKEYDSILQGQQGLCAICRRPETVILNGRIKRLMVDHDHATSRVRGLLCQRCNSLLGYAKDETRTLLAAVDYLDNICHQ